MYYAHENPGFESRSDIWCFNNVVDVMSRQKSDGLITLGSRDFYPLQTCTDHLRDPPSFQFSGQQGSVAGAKRPECEVNPLSSSMTEVTNGWLYTATFLMHVHGMDNYNLPCIIFRSK